MENENLESNQQKLIEAVLDKKLECKEEYTGQKDKLLVKIWKSEMVKKYGKGGEFYYCKLDGLHYYADKDEAIKNKQCPKCKNYCCPFCNYSDKNDNGIFFCCVKGRIRAMFLFDFYACVSERGEFTEKDKILLIIFSLPIISTVIFVAGCSCAFFWKLDKHKNGQNLYRYEINVQLHGFFNTLFILNCLFGLFISIPYFLIHYILVMILGVISIFNKKPFYGYFGIVVRAIAG